MVDKKKSAAKKAVATKSAATKAANKTVRVTLVRSIHGRLKKHQACARGLGLRRIRQSVEVADTPENRGMMRKIAYMLEFDSAPAKAASASTAKKS